MEVEKAAYYVLYKMHWAGVGTIFSCNVAYTFANNQILDEQCIRTLHQMLRECC